MANLRKPGGMAQRDLLVSWTDKQDGRLMPPRKTQDGKDKEPGIYLNVQLLNATKKDAEYHPYLNPMKNGKAGSQLYQISQFEAIEAVSNVYTDKNGVHYMTCKADLTTKKIPGKDGQPADYRVIMNIPTKDAEKMAKHPVNSTGRKVDAKLLAAHEKNTQYANEAYEAAKAAQKGKQNDAPEVQNEAAAEMEK